MDPMPRQFQSDHIFTLYDDYESAHQTGVPIKITFDSADGLGKDTKIKYHGITVGKVDSVKFGPSLEKVVLSAHLDRSFQCHGNGRNQVLDRKTRIWPCQDFTPGDSD